MKENSNIRMDRHKSENEQYNKEYYQNEVEEGNTSPSIHMLNDDCLTLIFRLLPIAYRVRIERVCKRWKALSQKSWGDVKKLEVSNSFIWGCDTQNAAEDCRNSAVLPEILKRCGWFLYEIDLCNWYSKTNYSGLDQDLGFMEIFDLCPNLQTIDTGDVPVSAYKIHLLTKNVHNVRRLRLGFLYRELASSYLPSLFKAKKKLRYLEVRFTRMHESFLLHLPSETMEELILEECYFRPKADLLGVMKKLKNLRNLSISGCTGLTVKVAEAIGVNCKNLRTLTITNSFDTMREEDMLPLAHLVNLEVLDVSHSSAVSDEFLLRVASKCQKLTNVDISGNPITGRGLAGIMTLPKLQELMICYIEDVTSFPKLQRTCNLKSIICQGSTFSDEVITNIMAICPQLEYVDLLLCPHITNVTLENAAALTSRHARRKILKICVKITDVNLTEFTNVSPFLEVDI